MFCADISKKHPDGSESPFVKDCFDVKLFEKEPWFDRQLFEEFRIGNIEESEKGSDSLCKWHKMIWNDTVRK